MTNTARLLSRGSICAALLAFPLLRGAEWPLHLDASATKVSFTLGDVLHTVHGEFKLKQGTLRFDSATSRISGDIVVDARSGQSGSSGRDNRMHHDILQSDRYPDIVFHPDRVDGAVTPGVESPVKLHGIFSIHGADHEITVPAQIRATGEEYAVNAHFDVPYVKWGMKDPSNFILRVNNTVQIDVHTVARQSHDLTN